MQVLLLSDVGVVVPYDYAKLHARGRPVTVQILLNGVNANTAQIAQGHVEGAIASHLNPIAHFAIIARSVLVKGAGLDVVYPHLLALAAFSIILVGISAWRFRGQLS